MTAVVDVDAAGSALPVGLGPVMPALLARARAESRRLRRRSRRQPRFPLDPIIYHGGFTNYRDLGRWCGRTRVAVQSWVSRGGVTPPIADELATRLDLHPALVWPDWWERTAHPDELADLGGVA